MVLLGEEGISDVPTSPFRLIAGSIFKIKNDY
jgi:hypothetical protein